MFNGEANFAEKTRAAGAVALYARAGNLLRLFIGCVRAQRVPHFKNLYYVVEYQDPSGASVKTEI